MRCGNCGTPLAGVDAALQSERARPAELPWSQIVTFQTSGAAGRQVRIHFCSLRCIWWGGQKYARSTNPGAPTTLRTFRALYPGAVE